MTSDSVNCFGSNFYGQLGRSANVLNQVPHPVPTVVPGLSSVTAVTAGGLHTCALKSDGTVVCFGANGSGQLGRTTAIPSNPYPTPTLVPGVTGITAIEAGDFFTCLLKNDGTVYCFGANASGQLGVAASASRSTPAIVPGVSGVVQLAVGRSHVCALKSDATVVCWGGNIRGELGNATNVGVLVGVSPPANAPTTVAGLSDVVSISAGSYYTCAVKGSGSVVCFGSNEFGGLGIPFVANASPTPTEVPGVSGATVVSSGFDHTCALATGGLQCWGRNWFGQTGSSTNNGTDSGVYTPAAVPGLSGPSSAFSTGNRHSCVVLTDTTVSCFGANRNGELGSTLTNGTDTPNPVPSLVQS